MSIPTSTELGLLRTQPQQTKLWLSIYKPTTILACRVNDGSITVGSRSITYDGVTSGSYVSVQSGMVMLIGTTLGGSEKGKIRVRSATSSVITVAENSHINWADDDYLTILNYFEITAIYPRIIVDPANPMNTLWYKDYDVTYTNQNDILGSFICMGSHYAGFVGDQVYYSASGTSNVLSDTLSYSWWMDGATVTGSSSKTPGYFTYNTPGHYTTRLTVSGSSTGAVDVSYRHVSIYNRPESGTSTPILRWELLNYSGQRDSGGYTAKIRVYDDTSSIMDNALVVLFSENWYGNTKQSIGGNAQNRSNIVFSGYILSGSIRYSWRDSSVEFEIGSPSEIMKAIEGFSVAANTSSSPSADTNPDIPSKWCLVKDMNIKRGIYHYLRWHSTVLMCNDFEFRGDDQYVQYIDTDRTSLFDAVNTLMRGALYGSIVCDRQGKVWAEIDTEAVNNASSAFPTTMTFSKQDWMEEPAIEERQTPPVSFLEMGGISYVPASAVSTPYLASAPGSSPGYGGKNEQIQGLALADQNQLNTLVGNVFAYKNARYPSVTIQCAGNFANLDIAPQELVKLNIAQTDTVDGIVMVNKPFRINGISWNYDPEIQIMLPVIELTEITQGFAGATINIPPIAPVTGYVVPPTTIPGIPNITINMVSAFGWSLILGNGTDTIATGLLSPILVPYNCKITSVSLVSTSSGNMVVDLWKCSYAQIDNSTHPVVGDSIIGAGSKPTLSSAYKTSTSLAGWTTTNLSVGDWLYVNIDSTDLTEVTLAIAGIAS